MQPECKDKVNGKRQKQPRDKDHTTDGMKKGLTAAIKNSGGFLCESAYLITDEHYMSIDLSEWNGFLKMYLED